MAIFGLSIISTACSGDSGLNKGSTTTISPKDTRINALVVLARAKPPQSTRDLNDLAVEAGFTQGEIAAALNTADIHLGGLRADQASGGTCPQDYEIEKNQEFDVPAGCNVKGDVAVWENNAFVNKFDNDANTGLIVVCPSGCKIKAPYGANVSPRTIDDLKKEMIEESGCVSKCKDVKVVTIGDSGKDGGSNTPTPSATATKTPSATPTSKPRSMPIVVDVNCDVSLEPGRSASVPKGCLISGDVSVDGKALFDNDQHTGLIVVLNKDVTVIAPYGASVTRQGPNPEETIEDVKSSMDQFGCGFPSSGGCSSVVVKTIS